MSGLHNFVCLPRAGLASRLGFAAPLSAEDKALTIIRAARCLLDELVVLPEADKQKLARLADMMGRGGWQWAGPVLSVWARYLARLARQMAEQAQSGQIWMKLTRPCPVVSPAPAR